MIYCIDSHIFIWGVKDQAETHDQHLKEKSKKLIKWLQDSKHQILVPNIVIAECLIREKKENHSKILSEAYKRFIVVDFDTRCALKYGEILSLDKWHNAQEIRVKLNGVREKMKLDHMILCCALVNGANGLITDDPAFTKFCEPHIKTLSTDISDKILEQTDLFEKK